MDVDLVLCMSACECANNTGTRIGNVSIDIECVTRCTQRHTNLFDNTAEKYAQIMKIIAVVLITFGLIGKVFNCIIFLRKPLRGTTTGLLLLLKTIFDTVPLLWTFIFDTKFFVKDEQMNASKIICVLSRSSDIFVSWSIGFVILVCTVRLATIIHSKRLPQPTPRHIFLLILSMMLCGVVYNWHLFVYPTFRREPVIDDKNRTFTYCNILFGRHMGYFSWAGFQARQEFLYNAPIVNFIVSSLIPFAIVAATNVVIVVYVLKASPKRISRLSLHTNGTNSIDSTNLSGSSRSSIRHMATQVTRKNVSYETKITVTTSCVFLTTNSIASIYVYLRTSNRSNQTYLKEDLKTSSVYLILRMLTLIDTVLEFYIYFLTGKKFREEVYHVIEEILQHTPLGNYFKFARTPSTIRTINANNPRHKHLSQQTSINTHLKSSEQQDKLLNPKYPNIRETICAIESTV